MIYVLLVAHFVADFIAQSDWMALNKSKRWDALAIHVGAYISVMALMVVWCGALIPLPIPAMRDTGVLLFVLVNAAAHFVQDAITSRINSRLWFVDGVRTVQHPHESWPGAVVQTYEVAYNDKRHWFFVGIGFDQLLHYITLFVTAGWWLK